MRKILKISIEDVAPTVRAVLEGQGIPKWRQHDGRINQLAEDAILLYKAKADPIGMLMVIAKDEFRFIFDGEGLNEDESPVNPISQASDNLALFAVTLGESVYGEISRLFQSNDFALGSMLDSAASEGSEMAAQVVENWYRRQLTETGMLDSRKGILRFSPGYCGWHISAQRKLFDSLRPGEIGITLNDSYLMQPLKSISGVIISGQKDIFYFDDTFSFCRDCATHTCRERIQAVVEQ